MDRSPRGRRAATFVLRTLAIAVTGVVALAPLAHAATDQAAATISVTPSSAPPGATITIAGTVPVSGASSCSVANPTQLTSSAFLFQAGGFGPQAPRDTDGSFSVTYDIPGSTPVGSYSIGILCGGGNVGITTTLKVIASPVTANIKVAPTAAQPGNSLVISGIVPPTGPVSCPAGDDTTLASNQALFPPSGSGPPVSRDAGGTFKTNYVVPSDAEPGIYTIGVRCGGADVGVTATLTVAQSATTTTAAPTTTSTTAAPTGAGTSVAQATTSPSSTPGSPGATTTTVARARDTKSTSADPAVWIVLIALVLVLVVGVTSVVAIRRRRHRA